MTTSVLDNVFNKLINRSVENDRLSSIKYHKHQKFIPCITVSREVNSGGRLVAELIAKKLGMRFYDKEFIELIAKNAKKRKSVVANLDEKSRTFVEDIIDSLVAPKDKFPEMSYFKFLCRTVLSLAEKGNCVILGRGANFIVPSSRCLRVSIIAPLKCRINNALRYEKQSLTTAQNIIRRIHFDRKDFIKRFFNKNISNANYYDVVINTEYLTIDQAVEIVLQAYGQKFRV